MMKDSKGSIIYVGKAVNLKSRLTSYFGQGAKDSQKTRRLVEKIADFDVIITKTEVEALLLERTMIKHHAPTFNILLRDDKEYPYVRVDFNEDWPRLEKVRRRKEDKAVYLGPFGSAGQLKILMNSLYRIFPLIRCSRYEFEKAKRPCNYYHMKMCLAPCVKPIEQAQYKEMMQHAVDFLKGKNREVVAEIKERMLLASAQNDFESAALYRDQLKAYESVTQRQAVVATDIGDADAIGFAEGDIRHSFHVVTVRDGFVVMGDGFVLQAPVQTADESLSAFLLQYYDGRSVPREILLPREIEDREQIANALLTTHPEAQHLDLKVPVRSSRLDLVKIANRNAEYRLEEAVRHTEKQRVELEVVRDKLKLQKVPQRIECIDISNIQGTAIVASCVCFLGGRPAKDQYRSYVVRDVLGGPDDYASIREVVGRRLERGVRDGNLPDLMVIDGGKGQLSSAYSVLLEYKGLDMELVSLAKSRVDKSSRRHKFIDSTAPSRSFERVFFPESEHSLALAPGTPEYRLLTQIRDEAHRFAITQHRKRRSKISHGSDLESIAGIGPAMRKSLLQVFGGVEGLKNASLDQLQAVKGIRKAAAVALHSYFRDMEEGAADQGPEA